MTRNKTAHGGVDRPLTALALGEDRLRQLEELVSDWLTLAEVAEREGVPLSQVRSQVKDRELVAVRRGPHGVLSVPAVFVTDSGPRPELRGTLTVLADGGMTDGELLLWLFTPDGTLPVAGAPMDALLSGYKTEVRKRAMEAAL